MKGEDLFEILSEIDDKYLQVETDAEKPVKHRSRWTTYAIWAASSVAAVLLLVLGIRLIQNYNTNQNYYSASVDYPVAAFAPLDGNGQSAGALNSQDAGSVNSISSSSLGESDVNVASNNYSNLGECDLNQDSPDQNDNGICIIDGNNPDTCEVAPPMIERYGVDNTESNTSDSTTEADIAVENGELLIDDSLRMAIDEYGESVHYRVAIDLFENGVQLDNESATAEKEMDRLASIGYIVAVENYFDGYVNHRMLTIHATAQQLLEFDVSPELGYHIMLYAYYGY